MYRRITILLTTLAVALTLAGCTAAPPSAQQPPGVPTTTAPSPGGAGQTRIANGLYDQADGTVIAVGTLEWRDLEGGFWAITGGTTTDVVAVIANVAKDDPAYLKLAGMTVRATGTRLGGVSTRMAGPEIIVTSITAFNDVNLPAG